LLSNVINLKYKGSNLFHLSYRTQGKIPIPIISRKKAVAVWNTVNVGVATIVTPLITAVAGTVTVMVSCAVIL
jgi:hypothetical protein